jgi:hypothetical protein
MGKLEFEMERNWQRSARYAAYETKLPESGRVYLQILDKSMGRTSKTVPNKLKVTIEWEDLAEDVLKV